MSTKDPDTQHLSEHSWQVLDGGYGDCCSYYLTVKGERKVHIDDITSSQGCDYKYDAAGGPDGDSLNFDKLVTGGSASRYLVCPPHLICFLSVTINDNANGHQILSDNKYMYPNPIRTRWADKLVYPSLNEIAEQQVKSKITSPQRYYLRSGHARLFEWCGDHFVEIDYHEVDGEDHWNTYVTKMIAQYCGDNEERLPFYLELNSDFEYFAVEAPHHQPDFKSVRNALNKTALKNFENESYWSKSVMKRMFDEHTIRAIVDENCSAKGPLNISDQEKIEFVQWLYDDRWRFLAVFILGNLDLSYLHDLKRVNEPITGSELPLDDEIINKFLDNADVEVFRQRQTGFRPINFPKPKEPRHRDVKAGELVPIHFDKKSDLIGYGGYGDVYKASIHSNYHTFSRNKNEKFALKVLKNPAISQAKREISVWEDIVSKPHNHILRYHASWSQKGQFYMLSPLAKGNLYKFLWENKEPFVMEKDLKWLLEQLEGLASGIEHIHNIGRKNLDQNATASDKMIDCGYHHDLKPQNILIFPHKKWVISDFGTVKLQQVVSQTSVGLSSGVIYPPPGDPSYSPPEVWAGKKPKEPYDIWSFGCILLEVLLWVFGHGGTELEEFFKERKGETPPVQCEYESCKDRSLKNSDTYNVADTGNQEPIKKGDFWYMCKENRYHLKPSVLRKLSLIKSEARERCQKLEPLCEYVAKMLSISPDARPLASEIVEKIGRRRVHAQNSSSSAERGLQAQMILSAQGEQSAVEASIQGGPGPVVRQEYVPGPSSRTSTSSAPFRPYGPSYPGTTDVSSVSTSSQQFASANSNITDSTGTSNPSRKQENDRAIGRSASPKISKTPSLIRNIFKKNNK